MFPRLLFLAVASIQVIESSGADWNQHLGSSRNGVSMETNLLSRFTGELPKKVWDYDIGEGWSAPVVSQKKAFIFYRKDDKETLDCLDLTNGKKIWTHSYPTHYRDSFGFEEGPRGTPAIDEQQVYCFGAEGTLTCLALKDGKEIWSVNSQKMFDAKNGFFGMACSPLVFEKNVILNIGGDNAGVVSWDKQDGKVRWKATADEASYSSPVVAKFDGQSRIIAFTREGLAGIDPENGRVKFDKHWRSASHASVNAATPLVESNMVFLTSSYDTGATLLRVEKDKVSAIWASDDFLSSHYSTPVLHDSFLYGFHGRQEQGAALRCIDFKTGKVQWEKAGFGTGTIISAGSLLLILSEQGELVLVKANATGYSEMGRRQILGTGVRAHAALSDGFYLARDKRKLVCLDLRGN